MSSKEQFVLSVDKGCFRPADEYTQMRLREKDYGYGECLLATLSKPRNLAFHRLAHAFGKLVSENIEDFEGLSAHAVLKRLQIEANIGCDEVALNFPGVGPCSYRIPRSLSFASMDEGEFEETFKGMCRYVAKRYWPDLDEDKISALAECMSEAA